MSQDASVYPSRYGPYEEALNKKLEDAAKLAVQGGAAQASEQRRPRWLRTLGTVILAVVGLALVTGNRADPTSRLSTSAGTMFSAQLAGAGASPEDLIPPEPAPIPTPTAEARPTGFNSIETQTPKQVLHEMDEPARPKPHGAAASIRVPRPTPCVDCQHAAPDVVLFDETGEHGVRVGAIPPAPAPVINIGSRIRAVVAEPITTSPGGTPVTAFVADSTAPDEGTTLPAGTRLVGDAFAIQEDDRVQVVFTALVLNGKTLPLNGVVLSEDRVLGLPAKVIKKASGGKRGLGKALGIVGSTLSFGLIPSGGSIAAAAASQVAAETARDLSQVEARWTRSDKVLRAPAANITVYLRSDLVLP
jgi:hypothetical protein